MRTIVVCSYLFFRRRWEIRWRREREIRWWVQIYQRRLWWKPLSFVHICFSGAGEKLQSEEKEKSMVVEKERERMWEKSKREEQKCKMTKLPLSY